MEDRLCARPRAGGRDLDEGAGERPGRPREAPALFPVQMRADPGAPPGLRPAGQPGGEGGGARGQSGPAPRARCRPARRPTRGRGARGEGRGGQGCAAPGAEARSGRMELACVPYSQETRIMQNHPHECEQALASRPTFDSCARSGNPQISLKGEPLCRRSIRHTSVRTGVLPGSALIERRRRCDGAWRQLPYPLELGEWPCSYAYRHGGPAGQKLLDGNGGVGALRAAYDAQARGEEIDVERDSWRSAAGQ